MLASVLAETLAQRRIGEHAHRALRIKSRIESRHEKTGLPVDHLLARSSIIVRDHGNTRGHRFERRVGAPLLLGRDQERGVARDFRGEIGQRAGQIQAATAT